MFLRLAIKSLQNRKGSVMMTVVAIGVSIFVLLGIEHIRHQAKKSFASTVSGVDLIVGARTGSLNLLLYSVFRIGAPTNNISWESYQQIISDSNVAWAIPIALGDSHKGYRVMGTNANYFQHFSYGNQKSLKFSEGGGFEGVFGVVLGAEVARQLGYSLGDKLVLAHGVASTSFSLHDDLPFTVVGILEPTGTPVDQTLHVSLQGIEAIHVGWDRGVQLPGKGLTADNVKDQELTPDSITAIMLGLNSRMAIFTVQRRVNQFPEEPLLAILPGVALSELWQMMGLFEMTLRLISLIVLVSAVLGLGAMLLASIRERAQEIRLLRVVGAPPLFLFLLIETEAIVITVFGIVLGVAGLSLCMVLVQEVLSARMGLHLDVLTFTAESLILIGWVLAATFLVAAVPSMSAFNNAKSVVGKALP
ncbi:MAG: ABC transporter permease [Halioglobus sp.]|nr:ABC transporter permease [Halioglobus sp.]